MICPKSMESSEDRRHHTERDGNVTERVVTGGGQLDEAQIAKSGGVSSVFGRGVRDYGCASPALIVRHIKRS